MEQLLVLFLSLFLIAVLLTAVVLPLVALVISSRTRKRLSEIQARIDRLEKTLTGHSIFPGAARPEPEARPAPATESEPETLPPPTIAHEPPPPQVIPPAPAFNAYQLESIIGRRWVGWVAVVLILFATAFFLKYAFDNRWIGELVRVSIGIAFGTAMCLAGFRYQRRGWRVFSQILTAGGIVLLYLSKLAAGGFVNLVGQK